MTKESARKRVIQRSNFRLSRLLDGTSYRDKTTSAEGRSHLFSGSDCDFADQVGADQQNRPDNKMPKHAMNETRDGTAGDSRFMSREVRFRKISYASVKY